MGDHPKGSPLAILSHNPRTVEEFWELIIPNKCTGCTLSAQRNLIVANRGMGTNGIMIIGQNPGNEEDIEGLPFIGPAGKLLDALLEEADINPDECWITNACKCHSEGNKAPSPKQLKSCLPYLQKEIELVEPMIVIAVGSSAVQSISDGTKPPSMQRIIKRVQKSEVLGCNYVPIWHTSYLLRIGQKFKGEKRTETIETLRMVKAIAKLEGSSRDR